MPSENDVHRAREADRLANHEPMLVEALTNMRIKALNALAEVDATDADQIRKYQAKVACTEEFLVELAEIIVAGQVNGNATEEQPE